MTHKEAKGTINKTRLTPASHDEFETVKNLLDGKPELVACMNALDPSYPAERPQGAAAHVQNQKILELMLERGVEMDIFMACALDRADKLEEFLNQDPSLLHTRGSHKIPLLMHVAGVATARVLVERGADVNAYREKRRGPLHHAVLLGNAELVELLLEHGADVNMTGLGYGMEGLTPLEIAEARGEKQIAELLRQHGVRPRGELAAA